LGKAVTETDGNVFLVILGSEGEPCYIEDSMNDLMQQGTHHLIWWKFRVDLKGCVLAEVKPYVGVSSFFGHLFDSVVSVPNLDTRR
jgi:hypothetical protein